MLLRTDFHLSFNPGFTAFAIVNLRLIVIVHDFDKFARNGRVLQRRRKRYSTLNRIASHSIGTQTTRVRIRTVLYVYYIVQYCSADRRGWVASGGRGGGSGSGCQCRCVMLHYKSNS